MSLFKRVNVNYLMMTIVWSIQLFIPITCQLYIFYPWLAHRDSKIFWFWVGIPFNVGLAMVYINYILACATAPGKPPPDWSPAPLALADFYFRDNPQEKKKQLKRVLENKLYSTRKRYCRKCKIHKPPRAHHCSELGYCVLKMDHNCPWTNNTIGFRNYGHFMRFLTYMCVMVLYCLILIGLRIHGIVRYDHARVSFSYSSKQLVALFVPPPSGTEVLLMVANIILLLGLCITVGILTGFQLFNVFSNTTTIESLEMDKMGRWSNRNRFDEKLIDTFPYSCGWYRNLQAVFGANPLFWWAPQKMQGSGLSFPIDYDRCRIKLDAPTSSFSYLWPPPEFFACKKAETLGWTNVQDSDLLDSDTDRGSESESEFDDESSDNETLSAVKTNWMGKPLLDFSNDEKMKKNQVTFPSSRTHCKRDGEGYLVKEVSWEKQAEMVDKVIAEKYPDRPLIEDNIFPKLSKVESSGTETSLSESPETYKRVNHRITADKWDN